MWIRVWGFGMWVRVWGCGIWSRLGGAKQGSRTMRRATALQIAIRDCVDSVHQAPLGDEKNPAGSSPKLAQMTQKRRWCAVLSQKARLGSNKSCHRSWTGQQQLICSCLSRCHCRPVPATCPYPSLLL